LIGPRSIDPIERAEAAAGQKPIDLDDYARAHAELPDIAKKLIDDKGDVIRDRFLFAPADPYPRFMGRVPLDVVGHIICTDGGVAESPTGQRQSPETGLTWRRPSPSESSVVEMPCLASSWPFLKTDNSPACRR